VLSPDEYNVLNVTATDQYIVLKFLDLNPNPNLGNSDLETWIRILKRIATENFRHV